MNTNGAYQFEASDKQMAVDILWGNIHTVNRNVCAHLDSVLIPPLHSRINAAVQATWRLSPAIAKNYIQDFINLLSLWKLESPFQKEM